jgi:hypothetical protein
LGVTSYQDSGRYLDPEHRNRPPTSGGDSFFSIHGGASTSGIQLRPVLRSGRGLTFVPIEGRLFSTHSARSVRRPQTIRQGANLGKARIRAPQYMALGCLQVILWNFSQTEQGQQQYSRSNLPGTTRVLRSPQAPSSGRCEQGESRTTAPLDPSLHARIGAARKFAQAKKQALPLLILRYDRFS